VDTKRGEKAAIQIRGGINFMILAVVIGAVLLSGVWKSGFSITFFGVTLTGQGMARDALFVLCIIASLILTPKEVREKNQFSWDPIFEVAKLFAGIFVCMGPVLAMLKAGSSGAFAPLVALVSNSDGTLNNSAFFWLSGALSSFLDNTPTYLAFFNLAGGDPTVLMGADAVTLLAISLGSVFMGANTYIGNAPNFMVLSIAQSRGVKMPSFFGYMAWSVGILIPTFLLIDWLYLM
jgi:Na+/H+ antiporter NhaD/arsenite permease-like protein